MKSIFIIPLISVILILGIGNIVKGQELDTSCFSTNPNDEDGDEILDFEETNGIDINNDGKVDLNLTELGANPKHKDVFLELDYMQGHKPFDDVIRDVVSSFKAAPVCNPDGTNGINLIAEVDEQVPEKFIFDLVDYENDTVHFKDFYKYKSIYFGNSTQRSDSNSDNILKAKELLYHYGIFIHLFNKNPQENGYYSGIARDVPTKDFVVSLGQTDPTAPHRQGTNTQLKGTLIHEFGHSIGLRHGGADDLNYKPNYLSRMNYHFQMESPINFPLDYSQCTLNDLNESKLIDLEGIKKSCPEGLMTKYFLECPSTINPSGIIPVIFTGFSVDWNGNNNINETTTKDINCESYPEEFYLLEGNDDWDKIDFIPGQYANQSFLSTQNNNQSRMLAFTNNNFSNNKDQLLDEMTLQDVKNGILGQILGINLYVDNISNSSLGIPNSYSNGTAIESKNIDTKDNSTFVRDYYKAVLGNGSIANGTVSLMANETSTTISEDIKNGNYDLAIDKIQKYISPTSDSSFGGSINDDLILSSASQLQFMQQITYLLNTLKAQTCSYQQCN